MRSETPLIITEMDETTFVSCSALFLLLKYARWRMRRIVFQAPFFFAIHAKSRELHSSPVGGSPESALPRAVHVRKNQDCLGNRTLSASTRPRTAISSMKNMCQNGTGEFIRRVDVG